jgi:hypothetical protein
MILHAVNIAEKHGEFGLCSIIVNKIVSEHLIRYLSVR